MDDEPKWKEVGDGVPLRPALVDAEVLRELLSRAFVTMDRRRLESCPPGCLAVLWPERSITER